MVWAKILHVVRSRVSCGGAYLTIAQSCAFSYGTRWCIHDIHACAFAECKILRYLVWISFTAALVKTL